MPLQRKMESSGSWLFKYRSFVPLLLLPLFGYELSKFTYLNGSHEQTEWWQMACLAVCLSGLAVRMKTAAHVPGGTSGRNTFTQVADCLNTTGMYSVVRHPLYLGNFLIVVGLAMFFRDPVFVTLVIAAFAIYYERIMLVEESFLRSQFGTAFEEWAERTPAFFPRLSSWKKPELPWSWRSMIRREYTTLLIVISLPAVEDVLGDSIVERRLFLDWRWLAALAASLLVFAVCRALKKSTILLKAEGR